MQCPQCAAEVPDGAALCPACGAAVNADAEEMTPAPDALPPLQPVPSYAASGRCPGGTAALLLVTAIVGGVVFGIVYHFVAQFIDIIIFFPIGAGIGIGALLRYVIKTANAAIPGWRW